MTITKLALSLLVGVGVGTGCSTVPPAAPLAASALPNCFDANYDKERGLFTMRNELAGAVNQQCLLTVRSSDDPVSSARLLAGSYTVYLAKGASVLKKNRAAATLGRFVVDDTVRFYGAVRQTNFTEVDAEIVRDLNF